MNEERKVRKQRILARAAANATWEYGDIVISIPVTAEAEKSPIEARAEALTSFVDEPLAARVTNGYLTIKTLGDPTDVLHKLLASSFGVERMVVLRPEATRPADTLEIPDGFTPMLVGEIVTSDCLMLTDIGWDAVTNVHCNRAVEAGESYLKPEGS